MSQGLSKKMFGLRRVVLKFWAFWFLQISLVCGFVSYRYTSVILVNINIQSILPAKSRRISLVILSRNIQMFNHVLSRDSSVINYFRTLEVLPSRTICQFSPSFSWHCHRASFPGLVVIIEKIFPEVSLGFLILQKNLK